MKIISLSNFFPIHLLGILTLLFLCSCERSQTPDSGVPSRSQSWPSTAKTRGTGFEVTVQPDSNRIEENKHFSVDLKVIPPNDEEYDVLVDADMPAHQHGMNTAPELKSLGPNHYRVDGMLFHMAGDWVITVTIGLGAKSEKLEFPVFVE